MWLSRDKADVTNKKLMGEFKFVEASASSGPVVDDVDQLVTLRKKYDELVAFTVQLTAERDELDAGLKLQKGETLRARDGAKAALMQTEVVGQDSVALAQKAAMYDHLAAALMPTALSCTDVKADSLRASGPCLVTRFECRVHCRGTLLQFGYTGSSCRGTLLLAHRAVTGNET
jgi:hypothetical protein